jgi:uroporphyrinogen decarboxylase
MRVFLKRTKQNDMILTKEVALPPAAKLENDLLLKALKGEKVQRPPVWMMRQAGRYLPQYLEIKKKYDFFTRVQTPELAAEITLQPVDMIGVDAAIIFSDILVVPKAMGLEVEMNEGKGPFLPETIKDMADVNKLCVGQAHHDLQHVYDAIRLTKQQLNGRVPLIGFAGAPWTLLCYMVEGKGSKTFDKAKAFCYTEPDTAHALLQRITTVTINYLKEQVEAGADCLQIFESWGGLWDKEDFAVFALPYIEQIVQALKDHCPVIVFAKGVWHSLPELQQTGASALSIDWTHTARTARALTSNSITLQGSYDPVKLLQPVKKIHQDVHKMIHEFGPQRYIVNLGHGIIPSVPVDHAKAFVNAVKAWKQN